SADRSAELRNRSMPSNLNLVPSTVSVSPSKMMGPAAQTGLVKIKAKPVIQPRMRTPGKVALTSRLRVPSGAGIIAKLREDWSYDTIRCYCDPACANDGSKCAEQPADQRK